MKRVICFALCLVLILTGAGCGQGSGRQEPTQTDSSQSFDAPQISEPAQAGFPVTVTDVAGREVTLEQEPKRLVSGYYITTSMLIALGQADKLVGVENKAQTRPIYGLAAPGILELPGVGTAKAFDLEGCAALDPDLVVLPMKLKETAPALEELGIPVLLANPENLEQLRDTLTMLGTATGATDAARELLSYYDSTQQELSKLLDGADKPKVYLAGNSSYLHTSGAKMYQNTLIEMGGGVNAAAELTDSYWAEISYEQLLAWDPDVIIIASEADYTKEDLLSDPQLSDLTAVRTGAVYAMPSAFEPWDAPVPGALMGSRWMASVLHEDRYRFQSMQDDVVEFYERFYGFEADRDLVTK